MDPNFVKSRVRTRTHGSVGGRQLNRCLLPDAIELRGSKGQSPWCAGVVGVGRNTYPYKTLHYELIVIVAGANTVAQKKRFGQHGQLKYQLKYRQVRSFPWRYFNKTIR